MLSVFAVSLRCLYLCWEYLFGAGVGPGSVFYGRVGEIVLGRRLVLPRRGILITVDKKTSSMTLLVILRRLGCHYRTMRYGFRLQNRRSGESRGFIQSFYHSLSVHLRIQSFSAVDCTGRGNIDVRVTTHRLQCSCFRRLHASLEFSGVTITRRQGSGIRALLLGLIQKAKLGKLAKVGCQGNFIMHPFLSFDHRHVRFCLRERRRNFVASDAGLRASAVHGGVHLRVLPVLGRVGPGVARALRRAAIELRSTYVLCGVAISHLGTRLGRRGRVSVRTLERFPTVGAILFRVLSSCKFGHRRASSVCHLLGKPSNEACRDRR